MRVPNCAIHFLQNFQSDMMKFGVAFEHIGVLNLIAFLVCMIFFFFFFYSREITSFGNFIGEDDANSP